MPLAIVPINRPLSSVTTGPVVAKTVAAAAQMITSNARRKAISARGTSEQHHDGKESWLESGCIRGPASHRGNMSVEGKEARWKADSWYGGVPQRRRHPTEGPDTGPGGRQTASSFRPSSSRQFPA